MRGKHCRYGCLSDGYGLIPACAGKTTRPMQAITGRWAHPRVCGENRPWSYRGASNMGSSPRVRGKRMVWLLCRGLPGLIPACAGKTLMQVIAPKSPTAHPRVCGENPRRQTSTRSAVGSSPRVRGKLLWADEDYQLDGLIPACAGKTRRRIHL